MQHGRGQAPGVLRLSGSSRQRDRLFQPVIAALFYHYKGDLLEHSSTGRVMRYSDGIVDVVADGLDFANGVVLAPDESTLDVAETGAYRITRIELTGAESGQTATLIGALPGFP
jgi:hypothetical protein